MGASDRIWHALTQFKQELRDNNNDIPIVASFASTASGARPFAVRDALISATNWDSVVGSAEAETPSPVVTIAATSVSDSHRLFPNMPGVSASHRAFLRVLGAQR